MHQTGDETPPVMKTASSLPSVPEGLLFENLSLTDAPSQSAQSVILSEIVSKLTNALATSPSGLLLTGADRATRRQIVSLAVPSVVFVSCSLPGDETLMERKKGAPLVCLDDMEAPPAEGISKGLFARRVGTTLLALASDQRRVPPSLLRAGRFEKVLSVTPPSLATREEAWRNILDGLDANQGRGIPANLGEKARELSDWSPGFGLTDFRVVLFKFLSQREGAALSDIPALKEIVASHKPVNATGELDFVNASSMVAGADASDDWNRVGGYAQVKEMLVRLCEWPVRHRATFARLGVTPPRGVLLHGPHGCGKTSIALAFLKRLRHANWLQVNAPDVFSKYLGESEARVRALFERARSLTPCVVFIDELDSMGGGRTAGGDGGGTGVERRVLGSLLTELDGVSGGDVFVLACATELDALDAALVRPGRLDHLVEVGRPNVQDRQDILRELLRGVPVGESNLDDRSRACAKEEVIHRVAHETEGMTGAELESLCREAAMVTMEQVEEPTYVELDHFWEANERMSKRIQPQTPSDVWGLKSTE